MKPYYEEAGIEIWNGNCHEIIPTLDTPDLVLTDPPYEMSANGGGIGGRRKYMSAIKGHIDSGFDIAMLDRFPNWVCFCAKAQLKELLGSTGDRVWALVTWNKPNPTPLCAGNYLPDTEYIVHAYQSGRLFGEYRHKSRFIVHPVEQNDFAHPTVKPIAVMSKMVCVGSEEGNLILDPFCGTGSTLVAARNLGRRAIGIELEERYCEIAARRLRQTLMDFGGVA
jgi:DNA modification methylase